MTNHFFCSWVGALGADNDPRCQLLSVVYQGGLIVTSETTLAVYFNVVNSIRATQNALSFSVDAFHNAREVVAVPALQLQTHPGLETYIAGLLQFQGQLGYAYPFRVQSRLTIHRNLLMVGCLEVRDLFLDALQIHWVCRLYWSYLDWPHLDWPLLHWSLLCSSLLCQSLLFSPLQSCCPLPNPALDKNNQEYSQSKCQETTKNADNYDHCDLIFVINISLTDPHCIPRLRKNLVTVAASTSASIPICVGTLDVARAVSATAYLGPSRALLPGAVDQVKRTAARVSIEDVEDAAGAIEVVGAVTVLCGG